MYFDHAHKDRAQHAKNTTHAPDIKHTQVFEARSSFVFIAQSLHFSTSRLDVQLIAVLNNHANIRLHTLNTYSKNVDAATFMLRRKYNAKNFHRYTLVDFSVINIVQYKVKVKRDMLKNICVHDTHLDFCKRKL